MVQCCSQKNTIRVWLFEDFETGTLCPKPAATDVAGVSFCELSA